MDATTAATTYTYPDVTRLIISHGAPRLGGDIFKDSPIHITQSNITTPQLSVGILGFGLLGHGTRRWQSRYKAVHPTQLQAAPSMAPASISRQSAFGLGRKNKDPTCLMDQISTFFGGDKKKKKSKGTFRGHAAASPKTSSTRRRADENAATHFIRSIVSSSSSPRPKSRASSLHVESKKSSLRRHRDQSTLSRIFNLGETRSPPKH